MLFVLDSPLTGGYILSLKSKEASGMSEPIKIRGLKQNNLTNISLDIPKNKIVVFTGVSGSANQASFSIRLPQKASVR